MQGFWAFLLSGVLDDIHHNVGALFNTQNTGVQADVIVLCLTPGAAGIVLIVDPAALILLGKALFGSLLGVTVKANNTLRTVGGICEYLNMQGILTVL